MQVFFSAEVVCVIFFLKVCKYTDTGEEVVCLFPFIGENPGQKRGGSSHDTCLKTKKGHTWCAVKVSLDNRLLGTSVQNRDIDCGQAKNIRGSLLCPRSSANNKPSTPRPTTAPRTSLKTNTGRTTTTSPRPWSSVVGTRKPGQSTTRSPGRSSSTKKPTGRVSDSQLATFSEQLLRDDENNVAGSVDLKVNLFSFISSTLQANHAVMITIGQLYRPKALLCRQVVPQEWEEEKIAPPVPSSLSGFFLSSLITFRFSAQTSSLSEFLNKHHH